VDHHLAALVDEDHEFEQIAGSIRSDDEPSVWILANVLDRQCVCNGMLDVEIVDAMPARRRMDLHTAISYYRIQGTGIDERELVGAGIGSLCR
jgi:hypothetical protein